MQRICQTLYQTAVPSILSQELIITCSRSSLQALEANVNAALQAEKVRWPPLGSLLCFSGQEMSDIYPIGRLETWRRKLDVSEFQPQRSKVLSTNVFCLCSSHGAGLVHGDTSAAGSHKLSLPQALAECLCLLASCAALHVTETTQIMAASWLAPRVSVMQAWLNCQRADVLL
jgi:hypothetical protein